MLKTFEAAVLRKMCGITKRDRLRNVDILKELKMEKGINEVLQTRRLTYFGHVTPVEKDRYPNILMHGYIQSHMDDNLEGDQGKGGWTTLQKIMKS